MLWRYGGMVAIAVLLVAVQLACCIPGFPPGAEEQTPDLSPTSGVGPPPIPGALPTPTGSAPTPLLPSAEDEGLTWLATGLYAMGEPEEGWQRYEVTLGYENTTDQFRNESAELMTQDDWLAEVTTKEGHTYTYPDVFIRGWKEQGEICVLPLHYIAPTGIIPPGFRVRGTVLHSYYAGRPCVSQVMAYFQSGETLHPETLTFQPTGETTQALADRVIDLGQPLETVSYGPIDPSRRFDSLPATVDLGNLRVTIHDGARIVDGKIVFRLEYKNTDSAEAAVLLSPIVSVIDSDGYLTAPGAFVDLGGAYPEVPTDETLLDYCPGYPIAYPGLGPLQEAEFQLCAPLNASGDAERRYFVVTCASEEGVWVMDQVHQTGSHPAGLIGATPDPPKECHVYEVSIVE